MIQLTCMIINREKFPCLENFITRIVSGDVTESSFADTINELINNRIITRLSHLPGEPREQINTNIIPIRCIPTKVNYGYDEAKNRVLFHDSSLLIKLILIKTVDSGELNKIEIINKKFGSCGKCKISKFTEKLQTMCELKVPFELEIVNFKDLINFSRNDNFISEITCCRMPCDFNKQEMIVRSENEILLIKIIRNEVNGKLENPMIKMPYEFYGYKLICYLKFNGDKVDSGSYNVIKVVIINKKVKLFNCRELQMEDEKVLSEYNQSKNEITSKYGLVYMYQKDTIYQAEFDLLA
jgi:hypothetical protein